MEDNEGATPLIIACQNDHVKHLELLLEQGASVNTPDMHGRTALHHCVENSTTCCAELLLKTDASLLASADKEGLAPLHMAVIAGNQPLVLLLLKRGASLHSRDHEEHTLAHWATVCGHAAVLDVLEEYGADLSAADKYQAYPLHYAAQMTTTPSENLSPHPNNNNNNNSSENNNNDNKSDNKKGDKQESSQQMRAGPEGSRTVLLKKLLEKGVCVEVRDKDDRTPIIWAASAGNADACRILVEAGADVNSADKDGLSALHCAASRGHSDCVRVLAGQCKAPVDPVDKNDCTPLFYASTLGRQECVNALLNLGAKPDHTDSRGRTTAHCAAVKGSRESLEALGKQGVDLWQPTAKGDYPIHEAAQAGHVEAIEYLLQVKQTESGVDTPNRDGRTCLHIAALTNNLWLAKFLLDQQADINALMKNKGKYYTPLDAAVAKGNKEAADYLQSRGAKSATSVRPRSSKRPPSSKTKDKQGPSPGNEKDQSPSNRPSSSKERNSSTDKDKGTSEEQEKDSSKKINERNSLQKEKNVNRDEETLFNENEETKPAEDKDIPGQRKEEETTDQNVGRPSSSSPKKNMYPIKSAQPDGSRSTSPLKPTSSKENDEPHERKPSTVDSDQGRNRPPVSGGEKEGEKQSVDEDETRCQALVVVVKDVSSSPSQSPKPLPEASTARDKKQPPKSREHRLGQEKSPAVVEANGKKSSRHIQQKSSKKGKLNSHEKSGNKNKHPSNVKTELPSKSASDDRNKINANSKKKNGEQFSKRSTLRARQTQAPMSGARNRSSSGGTGSSESHSRSRSRSRSLSSSSDQGEGLQLLSDNEDPEPHRAPEQEGEHTERSPPDEQCRRPRSSHLIRSVQSSVRRFEKERREIRQLQQVRRQQIQQGHSRNLALFHSLLQAYGRGAGNKGPQEQHQKHQEKDQNRSRNNKPSARSDSSHSSDQGSQDEEKGHRHKRSTTPGRRHHTVTSTRMRTQEREETGWKWREFSPDGTPEDQAMDYSDPHAFRQLQRQRTEEMHRLLLKAYRPALPLDLFIEGKSAGARIETPGRSNSPTGCRTPRPRTTKSLAGRGGSSRGRHQSSGSGGSTPNGMSHAQYRAAQQSYTIMTPHGSRCIYPTKFELQDSKPNGQGQNSSRQGASFEHSRNKPSTGQTGGR